MYNSLMIKKSVNSLIIVDKFNYSNKEIANFKSTHLTDISNFINRFYSLKYDNVNIQDKGYIIIQTNIDSILPYIIDNIKEVVDLWQEKK